MKKLNPEIWSHLLKVAQKVIKQGQKLRFSPQDILGLIAYILVYASSIVLKFNPKNYVIGTIINTFLD